MYLKKGYNPWNKGKECLCLRGENNGNYKHGLYKDRKYINKIRRECRHKIGISKRYIVKYGGIKSSILRSQKMKGINKKQNNQIYRHRVKIGGKLTIQTIQQVYENNIKQYGTLTCIYCLKPILFGKDTLEHKQPLSRNGTNEYNNLAIACRRCNCRKHNKTEEEFRKELLTYGIYKRL